MDITIKYILRPVALLAGRVAVVSPLNVVSLRRDTTESRWSTEAISIIRDWARRFPLR
jgi:hypothetical protein